jgi:hypothetical protein
MIKNLPILKPQLQPEGHPEEKGLISPDAMTQKLPRQEQAKRKEHQQKS